MIKQLIWTIWTPMSYVLKKADNLNLSLFSRDHFVYAPSQWERWHYNVTSSRIGCTHTQNDPCSEMCYWHWGILKMALVPVKQSWRTCIKITYTDHNKTQWSTCIFHGMFSYHYIIHISWDVLLSLHYTYIMRCTLIITLYVFHGVYSYHYIIHISWDVLLSLHYTYIMRCTLIITFYIVHGVYSNQCIIHISWGVL